MTEPIYGLVGRGRMASHMTRYLDLENRSHRVWHRGRDDTPEDALSDCGIILLLISDDALSSFLTEHPFLLQKETVHFSGSRTLENLTGLHPLMTFGPDLYDLETYRSIPFIQERGGRCFEEIFPGFANPSWTLDPALKPLYHALCVLSGNFTTLLWAKAMSDFEEKLALPGNALKPYLEQSCRNIAISRGKALTGPLARGDEKTIRANLEALAGDPWAGVYRSFAEVFNVMEGRK